MAIDSYTKLQTSIGEWLARTMDTDLTAVIPDLISLCEADMAKKCRTFYQLRNGVSPITTTTGIEPLPEKYSKMSSLNWYPPDAKDTPKIDFKTPPVFAAERKMYTSGRPCIYTMTSHNIHMWPPQDPTDEKARFEIWYYQDVEPLSGTVASNEILAHYPNIYLFGSLAQAGIWASDVRMPNYGGMYEDAVKSANDEAEDALIGSAPATSMPR